MPLPQILYIPASICLLLIFSAGVSAESGYESEPDFKDDNGVYNKILPVNSSTDYTFSNALQNNNMGKSSARSCLFSKIFEHH